MRILEKLPLLLLLVSMANAQDLVGLPEFNVLLVGSLQAPLIVNNADKSIIGYTMRAWQGEKGGWHHVLATRDLARLKIGTAGIPAGGSQPFKLWTTRTTADGTPLVNTRLALDSVIFVDGHFVGPDTGRTFDTFREQTEAIAGFAQLVLEKPNERWARMEAMVRSGMANHGRRAVDEVRSSITAFAEDTTADDLTLIRLRDGEVQAYAAAVRLAAIPKLWRDTQ